MTPSYSNPPLGFNSQKACYLAAMAVQSDEDLHRPVARKMSRIAAGHASHNSGQGMRVEDDPDGKPATILKVLDERESAVYEALSEDYPNDTIREFIPGFYGNAEMEDDDGDMKMYIRLQNLLQQFDAPRVMDVKIGCRTFMETEILNMKPRKDLFERMKKEYASQLTPNELSQKWITKHRWMTVRDNNSTIRSLGYRIDGTAGFDFEPEKLQQFRTCDDACGAFAQLVDAFHDDEDEPASGSATSLDVATSMLERLRHICKGFKQSEFVRIHECIGTSLLLVVDIRGQVGVFWIDFAKTMLLPDDVRITHVDKWEVGNHEDGLLLGIDNLVASWEKVVKSLHEVQDVKNNTSTLNMNELPQKKMDSDINIVEMMTPDDIRCSCSITPRVLSERHALKRRSWRNSNDIDIISALPAFSGAKPGSDNAIPCASVCVGDYGRMRQIRQSRRSKGNLQEDMRSTWSPAPFKEAVVKRGLGSSDAPTLCHPTMSFGSESPEGNCQCCVGVRQLCDALFGSMQKPKEPTKIKRAISTEAEVRRPMRMQHSSPATVH